MIKIFPIGINYHMEIKFEDQKKKMNERVCNFGRNMHPWNVIHHQIKQGDYFTTSNSFRLA